MATGQALVLGGGGVAGIAWMTGLLAGLAEAGEDVTGADVVIGTSAGANVAAQLGSGLPLRSCSPARSTRRCSPRELMAVIDWAKFAEDLEPYMTGASTPAEQLRNFGAVRARRGHGARAGADRGDRVAAAVAGVAVAAHEADRGRLRVRRAGGVRRGCPGSAWSTRWPPAPRCPASGRRSPSRAAGTWTAASGPPTTPTSPRAPRGSS